MFNVFEMICFVDPSNHFNQDFTLENFHDYDFLSLRKYREKTNNNKNVTIDDSEEEDDDDDENDDEENDDNKVNENKLGNNNKKKDKNDKYYFEDNDDHGIRMKHRFQIILCKYENMFDVVKNFDMFPSKVVFDGKRVYFTNKSLKSYQYMINEINIDGGTDMVKHRINKYFKYGFSMIMPPNTRKWMDKNYDNNFKYENPHYDPNYRGINENRGPISLEVRKMIDNIIIISHNSSIEKFLERSEELETKANENSKGLYISPLFCSFVSILRYVDINKINYALPQFKEIKFENDQKSDVKTENKSETKSETKSENLQIDLITIDDLPIKKSKLSFKIGEVDIEFKDNYAKYASRDWYEHLYKSMILKNYSDDDDNNNIDCDDDNDSDDEKEEEEEEDEEDKEEEDEEEKEEEDEEEKEEEDEEEEKEEEEEEEKDEDEDEEKKEE
jgi:hypothetical protein